MQEKEERERERERESLASVQILFEPNLWQATSFRLQDRNTRKSFSAIPQNRSALVLDIALGFQAGMELP